jgi:hypothetical protein
MNSDPNNPGVNITTKIEPVFKLTKSMLERKIDERYRNLIAKLNHLCANKDGERWFTLTIMAPDASLEKTQRFMKEKSISPDELIFSKVMKNVF